jgi:hypothetical protein
MRYWSARQILVLLLAVFAAAGMGLSVVQVSDMTLEMAMSSDMDAMADSGCQGCPTNDDGGAKFASCSPICTSLGTALLPQALVTTAAPASHASAQRYSLLVGRTSMPDPYPPRSLDLA